MPKPQILILLILSFCLFLSGCNNSAQGRTSVPTVVVQEVKLMNQANTLSVSGNITPAETVKLSFKLSGVVEQVLVSEGSQVRNGEAVAFLTSSDYLLQEKSALAQWQSAQMKMNSEIPAKINQAEAGLNFTQVSYDRTRALYESGGASQAQLDEISAKLTVDRNTYQQALEAMAITRIELGQAEAAYDLALSNVADTKLNSPIDGVVLQKLVSAGEVTSAGYPVVVIGKLDQVLVEIGVPDQYINRLTVGQNAEVYIYGLDRIVTGSIDEICLLADSLTRTFTVKIRLDNPENQIKPGMIAKVFLHFGEIPVFCVPLTSVLQLSTGSAVFVWDPATSTAVKQTIVTGNLIGDQIEVLSGLSENAQIIVEGQFKINDREEVRVK